MNTEGKKKILKPYLARSGSFNKLLLEENAFSYLLNQLIHFGVPDYFLIEKIECFPSLGCI